MASIIAKVSTVLHKSFIAKWKAASSYSPKKFSRKEMGPSKEAWGEWNSSILSLWLF